MSNWRVINEGDLAAHISQHEIDEFRLSQGFVDGTTPDPVKMLIEGASEEARAACRATPSVRLHPEQYHVPPSLISTVCEIVAYRILKRMPLDIGEARKSAYQFATERLAAVAKGEFQPEPHLSSDDSNNRNVPLVGFVFRPGYLR